MAVCTTHCHSLFWYSRGTKWSLNTNSRLTYFSPWSAINYNIALLVWFGNALKGPIHCCCNSVKFSGVFICLCREQIFRQSTELVCRAYGEVYAALTSPANAYKDPENLLPRSPEQVQTLLCWAAPGESQRGTPCRLFKESCNLYSVITKMYIKLVVEVGFFLGNVGCGSLTSERDMSVYRASCVPGERNVYMMHLCSALQAFFSLSVLTSCTFMASIIVRNKFFLLKILKMI